MDSGIASLLVGIADLGLRRDIQREDSYVKTESLFGV